LLEPLAETRDRDNRNWGKQLEVIDGDGVRHVWVMPAKMGPNVGDGVQFRSELVDRGLKIAAGPKARSRLSDYVTVWRPSRKVRCVTRTGWSGDAFVLPDKAYGGSEEIVAQIDGTPPMYAIAGSLQGWRDEIAAKCAGNSRLVFGVSTAFSGPILKIVNESSGGTHFLGESSKGKTTILHVARSVWGRELGTWRGTDNAAEAAAAGACDTLLAVDEIGQAAARVVGEMIYMLGNERGKQRMKRDGGLRQTYEWRLPFLSTGEVSIATKLGEAGIKARAGQEVRLIEVKADAGNGFGVFEDLHGFKGGAELADYLKAAADRNCGHPGREFLTRITAEMDTLPKTVSEARARFIAKYCPAGADGQVQRVCGRLAIVAIAGELATQASITGWRQGEAIDAAARIFKDWLDERGGAGAAEVRQAFEQVRLFLEQHGESRFTPAWESNRTVTQFTAEGQEVVTKTDRPTILRAGFRKTNPEGTTFYILAEVWRTEVCKGLNATDIASAMAERGWLLRGDEKNLAQKPHIPGVGKPRASMSSRRRS
jgi:putative DNA primase/helicase